MTQPTDPAHAELTFPSEMAVRYAAATMNQPVLVVAPDSRIRYANPAAAKLLGEPPERVEGQLLTDTVANVLGVQVTQRAQALLGTGSDTLFEDTVAGRTWLCHAVPLRDNSGTACSISLFCHDVSHIHAHAQAQLAAQQELTQTLVREVRHRVKNHLQGIVGLLRQHQAVDAAGTPALNNAITQLLTISAVYGLETRVSEDRIYLCSIVSEVVQTLHATYPAIHLQGPSLDQRATLDEEHSVSIALIVNELITNAIKHTQQRQFADVAVTLEFTPQLARLKILNKPAQLPHDMQTSPNNTRGAGLNLVRALLPIGRASLSLANEGEGVLTILTLLPPVVRLRVAETPSDA